MKKWISMVCAATLSLSMMLTFAGTASAETTYQMGDVNMDGVINLMDARLCYEGVSGQKSLSDQQIALGKVAGEATLTAQDAQRLYQFMAGQIFPLVKPVLYDYAYLQTLTGGFVDTIAQYAQEEGWTTDEFRAVCEKSAAAMTADELAKMNRIRAKEITPDGDTMMQKVITTYDMGKYLSGQYKTPFGSLSVCADVKQYQSTADFYYGLRLDYTGTYFAAEEDMAVIRFYASNIDKAFVPLSPENGGTVTDPYPFGGAGFTTGNNGRWGSPEWKMSDFTVLDDGAQLLQIAPDGTESLQAVYSVEYGRFVPVAA